jgi:hypothetical protein
MRCADFHVFSLRVQGPQPLPPTAQVILPSCRANGSFARVGLGVKHLANAPHAFAALGLDPERAVEIRN